MMVDMYLQGNSATEIGNEFGASKTTIIGILHANDVAMRENNEAVIDHNYFENINTPRKAQYLGFILADGSVGALR
ncbi:hypothetical protein COJ48_24850 [Bacillus cereus]|nr:hypothetical protein COJ48_24850 [Bacillus cereus]PGP86676.1 hypothetical protein CN997_05960 [Bacillus cereus]